MSRSADDRSTRPEGDSSDSALLPADLRELFQPAPWNDMPRRIKLCQRALRQVERTTYPELWAMLQIVLGSSLAQNPLGKRADNLERAIDAFQQALEVATRQTMPVEWTVTMDDLLANLLRIPDDQVEKLERTVKIYQQIFEVSQSPEQLQTVIHNNLGLALLRLADAEPEQRQSHLSRAAESLRQAVELSKTTDDLPPLWLARARYHLGRCYSQLGRWREATALLEEARETLSQHKARPELAGALLELGQLYHQRRDLESAYIYLKDALRLFRRLKDTVNIAITQEALGNLTLQTARPADALAFFQNARQGYVTLERKERIQAIDELLRLAHQSHQIATEQGATL